eukprot:scpid96677/ scgid3961/ Derlin-2; Degradation in endoplasmic reticulum protein 2; Der1-like protein 2; F-LAN-1; F-LANa &gt; Derlin-2; Degradation in endoplasmic reticulum protein 2; Der1-like protein 2
MAHNPIMLEYMAIPPVTRAYTTACLITTILVQVEFVTPLQLYFNPYLTFRELQLWRLVTNFLFFGQLGFHFFFNLIFVYRYSRMLEEGSFRGRTADFVYMFALGGVGMLFCGYWFSLLFLGQAFTIMLVYIWGQRNRFVRMNFLFITFRAPQLPWVLLGFSFVLGSVFWVDVLGIAVGHVYYFLADVFPRMEGGCDVVSAPRILKVLFDKDSHVDDANAYRPPAEDQPGGYDWGAAIQEQVQRLPAAAAAAAGAAADSAGAGVAAAAASAP